MKKIVLGIALLFFVTGLSAQKASKGDEKSKEEVQAAIKVLHKAMIDGDRSGLENITAEGLSYGHSSGVVEDKKTFIENIASGKSDFVTIETSDENITLAGDTALARFKMTGTTNNNGTTGNLNIGILLVWQKQKGDWRLLARQAIRLQ